MVVRARYRSKIYIYILKFITEKTRDGQPMIMILYTTPFLGGTQHI